MKAKKFEQRFEEGVDITDSLDLTKAKRVLWEQNSLAEFQSLFVSKAVQ